MTQISLIGLLTGFVCAAIGWIAGYHVGFRLGQQRGLSIGMLPPSELAKKIQGM